MKVFMTNQALHWWGDKATSVEASLRLQNAKQPWRSLIFDWYFHIWCEIQRWANWWASHYRLFLWRLNTISVKKLNLPFTGRLFKSVAGRADFTINKYHTCVHMQLPIIVSILLKSGEVCVCKGSGKFHDTFLMAAATECNSFPTDLECLIRHFSLRNCNMQTDVGKFHGASEWGSMP